MKRTEKGAALLEIVAALAVLSLASLTLIEVVSSQIRSTHLAAQREREIWDQDRLLSAHALLSATDLDLRLGTREAGPYLVTVQRPEPTLYRIAIARRSAPEVEDLVTVVHRNR